MRTYAFSTLLLLLLFHTDNSASPQVQGAAVIEGTIYDLYGAVIPGVRISVENADTGEIINLQTDDRGRYVTKVDAGHYVVSRYPSVGYPIGYQHARFAVSTGEMVLINFRPKPFSISDSIKDSHWSEKYIGEFPGEATHFIQQNNGAIKDVRIQYQQLKSHTSAIEYRFSVTASFDRYTMYADKVIFDAKNRKLIAEGDVLFEDGKEARRARGAEIDLSTNSPPIIVKTTSKTQKRGSTRERPSQARTSH